jgi:hypothetical protein
MRDSRGRYYFQKGRLITNKNIYIRWSQAWMLLALVLLARASQSPSADEGHQLKSMPAYEPVD